MTQKIKTIKQATICCQSPNSASVPLDNYKCSLLQTKASRFVWQLFFLLLHRVPAYATNVTVHIILSAFTLSWMKSYKIHCSSPVLWCSTLCLIKLISFVMIHIVYKFSAVSQDFCVVFSFRVIINGSAVNALNRTQTYSDINSLKIECGTI